MDKQQRRDVVKPIQFKNTLFVRKKQIVRVALFKKINKQGMDDTNANHL